jgi:hypothetical protein
VIGPILLAVTWLLLRAEGKPLSAIGIDRGPRRIAEFVAGFAALGVAAAAQQLGLAAALSDPFVTNAAARPAALLDGARFVVNSPRRSASITGSATVSSGTP